MTKTKFAAAYGAFKLAEIEAGGFVESNQDADLRLREAEEALIAIRAPHRAGVLGKVERVAEHARDHRDAYGWLVGELEAVERELSAANADLAHVADALAVVARRFEREEMADFFVRLLRSAATDARMLAGLGEWHTVVDRSFFRHEVRGHFPAARIEYRCEHGTFKEWVSPENPKTARRFRAWWCQHGGAEPVPATVDEALLRTVEIRETQEVRVEPAGKWWEITGRRLQRPTGAA